MWTDKHRGQATLARRNEALRLSDALRDYKAKNPKASLREVASVFGVSHMTVKRAQKMRKFEAGKKGQCGIRQGASEGESADGRANKGDQSGQSEPVNAADCEDSEPFKDDCGACIARQLTLNI